MRIIFAASPPVAMQLLIAARRKPCRIDTLLVSRMNVKHILGSQQANYLVIFKDTDNSQVFQVTKQLEFPSNLVIIGQFKFLRPTIDECDSAYEPD